MKHIKDQHGTTTLRVLPWHIHLGRNHQLSNRTEDSLSKRETMPGTGNLANFSVLGKSWLSEGNLQPPVY